MDGKVKLFYEKSNEKNEADESINPTHKLAKQLFEQWMNWDNTHRSDA